MPPLSFKAVTSAYRRAIDAYFEKKLTNKMKDALMEELGEVYNRGFSSGFFLGKPSEKDYTDAYGSKAAKKKVYAGYVKNYYKKVMVAEIRAEAAEIKKGDRLIIIGNKTGVVEETAGSMQVKGKDVEKAVKGKSTGIKTKNIQSKNRDKT